MERDYLRPSSRTTLFHDSYIQESTIRLATTLKWCSRSSILRYDEVNCSSRVLTVTKMRGQTVDLFGIAVDQDSNLKPSHVTASYVGFNAEVGEGESRKETGNRCTALSSNATNTEIQNLASAMLFWHAINSRRSGLIDVVESVFASLSGRSH